MEEASLSSEAKLTRFENNMAGPVGICVRADFKEDIMVGLCIFMM